MKTIVLVEPNPLVRAGLRHLLEDLPLPAAVFYVDPTHLRAAAGQHRHIDLLILGISADVEAAQALLRLAVSHLKPRRTLLLCAPGSPAPRLVGDLGRLAYGCLVNDAHLDTLTAAIHLGLDLDAPGAQPDETLRLSGDSHALMSPAEPDPNVQQAVDEAESLGLTPRQYALLVQFARGKPLSVIAHDLGISNATAEAHASTLYQRLGARNARDAVSSARLRGARLVG